MVYGIGAVLFFIMLCVFKGSGSFFKSVFTSAIGGVGALCAVNALSYFIPLTVGVNWYTLGFSSIFSVPGVIFLLVSEVLLI